MYNQHDILACSWFILRSLQRRHLLLINLLLGIILAFIIILERDVNTATGSFLFRTGTDGAAQLMGKLQIHDIGVHEELFSSIS